MMLVFGKRYFHRWETWSLIGLYFVFGFFYWLALYITSYGNADQTIWLDYALKAVITLPFWWFFFRLLDNRPMWQRLLLHLPSAFFFAYLWQQSYYLLLEEMGERHLGGNGAFWDIYIPLLFYFIQFGLFHLYEYYHQLQEEQKRAAQLRETALSSELVALKAQLNPHFLYNTFNTISASVPPEQERTRELIADLSDLFRYQLQASKTDWVPLREEFTFVKNFLGLEKARFHDRLQISTELPAELSECLVPPMILQPLVENAVRHGIAQEIEGGTVKVQARHVGDSLRLIVSDTGPGMKAPTSQKGSGIGLHNTRRRLRLQFGSELHIDQNQPRGCRIWFELPLHPVHAPVPPPKMESVQP